MNIKELMELSLPDAHQHVQRDLLIRMIAEEQITVAVNACVHFKLNPKELTDVIHYRNDEDPFVKLEIIKGMIVQCPSSKSKFFLDYAYKVCDVILSESSTHITKSLFVGIMKALSKYHDDVYLDVNVLRKHGHVYSKAFNDTILGVAVRHELLTPKELDTIIHNNKNYIDWLEEHIYDDYAVIYRDVLEREYNRNKLIGHYN